MKSGKVEAVTFIKHISEGLDYCEVTIGSGNLLDFDQPEVFKIFDVYNTLMEYLNKYVEYTIRPDIFEGNQITVIASMVDHQVIQTVSRQSNNKLLPLNTEARAICTLDIESLKPGDYSPREIALLVGAKEKKSSKTKWLDCTLVDCHSKQFNLRVFTKITEGNIDSVSTINEMIGHYVRFDIRNTQYGFQTSGIEVINATVLHAPEVEVAISIIEEVVNTDEALREYVQKYDYINTLKSRLDGDIGYELVYIAAELEVIKSVINISDMYSTQLLNRAAIVSRGYMLLCNTKFSKAVLNFNKAIRTSLKDDRELLLIIDPMADTEISATKRMYYKIRTLAKGLIDERRVYRNEETDINDYDNFINDVKLSGLL